MDSEVLISVDPAATKAARIAVSDALEAWNKAPAHIRVMGAAYVGPLLVALSAIAAALPEFGGE